MASIIASCSRVSSMKGGVVVAVAVASVAALLSARSATSANTATSASRSTYAVSSFEAPRAMGTAMAPHSHAACTAATNSAPGTALTATRAPRRTSAEFSEVAEVSTPPAFASG
jgi:hypothetical protein